MHLPISQFPPGLRVQFHKDNLASDASPEPPCEGVGRGVCYSQHDEGVQALTTQHAPVRLGGRPCAVQPDGRERGDQLSTAQVRPLPTIHRGHFDVADLVV